MLKGIWGTKIGMTQVFDKTGVVPVTAIDVRRWFVTNVKKTDRDGYQAVQVGLLKNRYAEQTVEAAWFKQTKKYFTVLKEIRVQGELEAFEVGKQVGFEQMLAQDEMVDVVGTSKGCGFAGTVRRHGFNGAPASHGSMLGKRPGAMSFMRSQGRVIKGKRLPGRMGNDRVMIKSLKVIGVRPEDGIVLVKGSIPGRTGSLVFVRKAEVNND